MIDFLVVLKGVNLLRVCFLRTEHESADCDDGLRDRRVETLLGFVRLCGTSLNLFREFIAVSNPLFDVLREIIFAESFQPDKSLCVRRFHCEIFSLFDFVPFFPELVEELREIFAGVDQRIYVEFYLVMYSG